MKAMRIGEVAKACGVSVDTLRHYERVGVLAGAERAVNGYRAYHESTVERVNIIRRALRIGFTLDELSRIFRKRASGQAPCREVRALAAEKLDLLDERLRELTSLRAALAAVIQNWDERLGTTEPGELARLIESLTDINDGRIQ